MSEYAFYYVMLGEMQLGIHAYRLLIHIHIFGIRGESHDPKMFTILVYLN